MALATGLMATLTVVTTLEARYQRDVARIVFNRNLEILYAYLEVAEDAAFQLKQEVDLNQTLLADVAVGPEEPYLVVSLADRELTFRAGNEVLMTAPVAIGKGAVTLGGKARRFDTPRGRRKVLAKEKNPKWVPPRWHYVEVAQRRGLTVTGLNRGESVTLTDGTSVTVQGSNVGRVSKEGEFTPFRQGKDIVVDGRVIVPPFGTIQRSYPGELGTRRLLLGNGYAIHGTDKESTVGTASSHGCLRMKNADIESLYDQVPVGTPIFIY